MKIIARGIFQKMLKYWTIRCEDGRPSNPVTQRIILEIDWFYVQQRVLIQKKRVVTVMSIKDGKNLFC